MPIYFKKSDYEVPKQGLHNGVCVDVVDLGIVQTGFGPADQIKIVWQLEAVTKKGKRFTVQNRYTPSKSPKSNLRKMLESWRGKPFTKEEINDFDIEKLLGANCQLSIAHKITDDATYANVMAVIPAASSATKLYAQDYEREVNRPGYVPPHRAPVEMPEDNFEVPEYQEDEDIPF